MTILMVEQYCNNIVSVMAEQPCSHMSVFIAMNFMNEFVSVIRGLCHSYLLIGLVS